MKFRQRTSDLQLAFHLVLAQVVDGPAGVSAPIEHARFADVQSQHALFVHHQVLGVVADDHVVLLPDDLGLKKQRVGGWTEEETRGGGGSV